MAAAGKERLNLKICIDNVNELSDDQQSDARMSSATDDEESSGASSDTNIESKSLVATPGDNKVGNAAATPAATPTPTQRHSHRHRIYSYLRLSRYKL